MGLLDGRKALIFGVANDHSIAWGIAKAFHEAGATVGFSSMESLIERRVRPLATSIGATFVEPCDIAVGRADPGRLRQVARGVRRDRRARPCRRLREARGPRRRSSWTRRGTGSRPRSTCRRTRSSPDPRGPPVHARRLVGHDAQLLRRREGRHPLQRDGRREGRARGDGPLPRRRPRARGDPRQRHLRGADPDASAGGIAGFRKLYGPFNEIAPLRRT